MNTPAVALRNLKRADLAAVDPWFRDPQTRRYLGNPGWVARIRSFSAVS